MINLALENDNAIQAETEEQNPLFNFFDYTVLLITQANTAEDIDLLMDDFMSPDVINILEENKGLFSLLNAIWFTTFKRVFVDKRSESFPLKMLALPILFKRMGWEIEDIETFENANFEFRTKTQGKNDLYAHLVQLFMNGLKFTPSVALNLFKDKIEALDVSEQDKANIDVMIKDIEELGWVESN
ncbi:MAG: hypothetical protein R3240_06175 [Gammaproteobacteria bacterium]|nr:hypothetical protein [Gammaproteobacteria bacterium]